jgi:hypothetical protein
LLKNSSQSLFIWIHSSTSSFVSTVRRADSIEGIVFQVIMAHSWLDLAENGDLNMRKSAFRVVTRLLWQIRETIGSTTDVAPSQAVSDFYMCASDDRPGAVIAAAPLTYDTAADALDPAKSRRRARARRGQKHLPCISRQERRVCQAAQGAAGKLCKLSRNR